jgi:hypothetical protein
VGAATIFATGLDETRRDAAVVAGIEARPR